MKGKLSSAISAFGLAAKAKLANPATTGEPEDQLRAPFEQLLGDVAELAHLPRAQVVAVGGRLRASGARTRADQLAHRRFGPHAGLASPEVTVADPATGTGTFLLGVLRQIAGHSKISKGRPDAWLYFYEDFLEVYDNALRKLTGSYYSCATANGPSCISKAMSLFSASVMAGPTVGSPSLRTMAAVASGLLALGVGHLPAEEKDGPVAGARPSFKLTGFAAVPGDGLEKLTGGGEGAVVEVRTAREFQAAVERTEIKKKADRENVPRVVKVLADLDLGELANDQPGNEIKAVGRVRVASNTTIYAPGAGATLRRGMVEMHGTHNVIIRNLKFRDLWEHDPTGAYDRFGWDYVRIVSSGKIRSHHVWIDHCDFGKSYDGQCDITHGSDLITVSWCRFAGDARGPHKKSMLIGHSSSATAGAVDAGRLNVTLHHNWFENIDDRAPRARWGNIHVFNDFVDGAENATISVMNAVTLVERCVYRDARIATTFAHAADNEVKDRAGKLCLVESRNDDPRPPVVNSVPGVAFEIEQNFHGNVERAQLAFNPVTDWVWKNPQSLPYAYVADPVEAVPELVRQFAGTGKVPDGDLPRTDR